MKTHTAPKKRVLAGGTMPPFIRNIYYSSYMLPNQPLTDPRISVILSPAERFPNHVYLACGNGDVLYNLAVKFVERLKDVGHKNVEFVGLEYMGHGFDIHAEDGTEAGVKLMLAPWT